MIEAMLLDTGSDFGTKANGKRRLKTQDEQLTTKKAKRALNGIIQRHSERRLMCNETPSRLHHLRHGTKNGLGFG